MLCAPTMAHPADQKSYSWSCISELSGFIADADPSPAEPLPSAVLRLLVRFLAFRPPDKIKRTHLHHRHAAVALPSSQLTIGLHLQSAARQPDTHCHRSNSRCATQQFSCNAVNRDLPLRKSQQQPHQLILRARLRRLRAAFPGACQAERIAASPWRLVVNESLAVRPPGEINPADLDDRYAAGALAIAQFAVHFHLQRAAWHSDTYCHRPPPDCAMQHQNLPWRKSQRLSADFFWDLSSGLGSLARTAVPDPAPRHQCRVGIVGCPAISWARTCWATMGDRTCRSATR